MANNAAAGKITNVFVLVLENRAFDHMLGFSGITGTDAQTGQPTQINGLTGTESNSYNGQTYTVTEPADFVMPLDPGHDFLDVLEQLCGTGATYPSGGPYPALNNSGFVANYARNGGAAQPAEIMKCYNSSQLPVLNALATNFAVCDNWFCSMPGPTWPNRFFLHAASAGGLDHSPTNLEMSVWFADDLADGFSFQHGTIFDALSAKYKSAPWRIYRGDLTPISAAIRNIFVLTSTVALSRFALDLKAPGGYPWLYTFIEPNYGDFWDDTYANGTSQHPLDDVTHGELLIKQTYEAIRSSPVWNTSLLIVTWDEHGGFYDHVGPPAAVAPGDATSKTWPGPLNKYGFTFDRFGPRVPAVVVSPLVPRNLIDHRLYDHASVPATVEAIFELSPLTQRDKMANNVTSLASLATPRTDCPLTLPEPAVSGVAPAVARALSPASRLSEPIGHGNLPGFLHIAARNAYIEACRAQHQEMLAQVSKIRTKADALQFLAQAKAALRRESSGL